MKKYFYILISICFLAPTTSFAIPGACSYHNGVNCSAGQAYDGNAICYDGSESSVSYSEVDECSPLNICYVDQRTHNEAETQFTEAMNSYQATNQKAVDTINGYINGTIPFNPNEQAQIDSYKAQMQPLINQEQELVNNASSPANTRYGGTNQSSIDAATQELNNLQTEMNGEIAQLEQSFKDNDIKLVKEALDTYNAGVEPIIDHLQSIVDCEITLPATTTTSTLQATSSNISTTAKATTSSMKGLYDDLIPKKIIPNKNISTSTSIFYSSSTATSTFIFPRTLTLPSKFKHWYDYLNPFNWF